MTHPVTPLSTELSAGFTAVELGRIQRAYELAAHFHAGQVRKSGDPYITHPVAVAEIVAELGLDCDSVCAALLHDVITDTECTSARLRAEFGDEITGLVQGMSDLDRQYDQAAIDGADDRVLTLKVLDRLHNMRTLQPLPLAKRQRKSRETVDLVAPVARRLGLQAIADELETIARQHLPSDTGLAGRVLALASMILPAAFRASYRKEWLGDLEQLRGRRARAWFAVGLLYGMPALALALRRSPGRTSKTWLLAVSHWILRSNSRTWAPLALFLGWVVMEIARNSLGDAIVALITVPPVFHAGVGYLRAKLGLSTSDE
ncbi:HD domain-containing protein [Nonomuraea harbinensis]|uniref:HD domain-containing protein n=1 Tax=Nonomuraea harbinensis TaxID=1286938 RepID=A0ABW1BZ74_9ACTN|nr:HD domain-containing protein [Nonomuraea harbinensis]